MPQVRVEATDLIMVKAETDNLEGLYHETEAKDLNIVSISFRIIAIREAHHNKNIHNMVRLVLSFTATNIEQIMMDILILQDENAH